MSSCGNFSSPLKPWALLNPYWGSERPFHFLPFSTTFLYNRLSRPNLFLFFFLLELAIPYSLLLFLRGFLWLLASTLCWNFPLKKKKKKPCQNTMRAVEKWIKFIAFDGENPKGELSEIKTLKVMIIPTTKTLKWTVWLLWLIFVLSS